MALSLGVLWAVSIQQSCGRVVGRVVGLHNRHAALLLPWIAGVEHTQRQYDLDVVRRSSSAVSSLHQRVLNKAGNKACWVVLDAKMPRGCDEPRFFSAVARAGLGVDNDAT